MVSAGHVSDFCMVLSEKKICRMGMLFLRGQCRKGRENMGDAREKIEIPEIVYQGDDRKLKERIFKFKAGSLRIAVFSLVGLFMGFYSHTYVTDTFFPTKLLVAIPYKLTEAIYGSILRTDAWTLRGDGFELTGNFFPHSAIACLLAEPFTTMLIGAAVYGSLAYFTGDKRVFTLQRFLKFAGCWCIVILLAIGAAFGVNAKAKEDNESFSGDASFYLYDRRGWGSYAGPADGEVGEMLQQYFFSELAPVDIVRDRDGEVPLGIIFNGVRYGLYQINPEAQYVVTEQGKIYHISEDFARVVSDYIDGNVRPGIPGAGEVAE